MSGFTHLTTLSRFLIHALSNLFFSLKLACQDILIQKLHKNGLTLSVPKYHPWGTHLQTRLGTWPWGNGGSLIMVDFTFMEENSDNLISKCEII
jgi:hypothetical protein